MESKWVEKVILDKYEFKIISIVRLILDKIYFKVKDILEIII